MATLTIAEDGQAHRCNLCGMFTMNIAKHQKTKICKKGQERRKHEKLQDLQAEAGDQKFYVYGQELERVKEFKYLGRIIREDDDDTQTILEQIKKARGKWNSIAKILKREGANAQTMAKFYMTVIQAVLLYGADSWTITKRNWKRLEAFHHRAVRYMTGQHIKKKGDGSWEYPNHLELEKKCGLFSIETYIKRRRGTLRKYLEEHKKDLLVEACFCTPPSTNPNKILWWHQDFYSKEEMRDLQSLFIREDLINIENNHSNTMS